MKITRRAALALPVGVLAAPHIAAAQSGPIKIGVPIPLSGPAALYGDPAVKGAHMFVQEINAAGGVLGRKLELIVRDSKASPDEAVRVAREMILKENVDFLVGTLTSAEGPAVSTIAKENKIVLIAPIPKTDQLTSPKNLHPYIFRTSANSTTEGRICADLIGKWVDAKRVGVIAHDYAYGQDIVKEFTAQLKKSRPDMEVVDVQWPKLGEGDYTPFINAQMSKKPDVIFSAMWGGHFVTWAKQAKPLGMFDAVKNRVVNGGEAGSVEATRALGAEYPFGIIANAYDVPTYPGQSEVHKKFVDNVKAFTKEAVPSSWPILMYVGMQFLVEGIKKAGAVDNDKVAAALLDLTIQAPFGPQTMRRKDQQANRGEFYGEMVKGPDGNAVMKDAKYIDPAPFMD